jgi:hypothetical protein
VCFAYFAGSIADWRVIFSFLDKPSWSASADGARATARLGEAEKRNSGGRLMRSEREGAAKETFRLVGGLSFAHRWRVTFFPTPIAMALWFSPAALASISFR